MSSLLVRSIHLFFVSKVVSKSPIHNDDRLIALFRLLIILIQRLSTKIVMRTNGKGILQYYDYNLENIE